MNKRVHQIAKERGLPSKDLLERLRAAGLDVKAASSNVDEDAALKVLGNGAASTAPATDGKRAQATGAKPAAPAQEKAKPSAPAQAKREASPRTAQAPEPPQAKAPA